MATALGLDALWDSAPRSAGTFATGDLHGLLDPARRYLEHAIAPGTPLVVAVRIRMHGEIKIRRWFPFRAEEVIRWDRGLLWRAVVRMYGLPVRGFDRLVDGESRLQWRLLGLVPLVSAGGADVTRSGAGRLAAESVWLPSVLCRQGVAWTTAGPSQPRVRFTVMGEPAELLLTIGGSGQLQQISLPRWGNPDGGPFQHHLFGGIVEDERTFSGYTIPTRLRIGWHAGTERFESGGEFFRVTVDDASYR
jgi:hypothetical protein